MSIFTDTQSLVLAQEVSRACRISLYGLHYHTNWQGLRNKQLIIKALKINDNINLFTSDEESCLMDKLTSPQGSCISCS